jgi:hypothetical protein
LQFWTNVFPTKLVERHTSEIKRFKTAIKIMRWFELFFALIPIKITLRMFLFSNEFINYMIYPSLALFLGWSNYPIRVVSSLMMYKAPETQPQTCLQS